MTFAYSQNNQSVNRHSNHCEKNLPRLCHNTARKAQYISVKLNWNDGGTVGPFCFGHECPNYRYIVTQLSESVPPIAVFRKDRTFKRFAIYSHLGSNTKRLPQPDKYSVVCIKPSVKHIAHVFAQAEKVLITKRIRRSTDLHQS
jgi:hypothetical protein